MGEMGLLDWKKLDEGPARRLVVTTGLHSNNHYDAKIWTTTDVNVHAEICCLDYVMSSHYLLLSTLDHDFENECGTAFYPNGKHAVLKKKAQGCMDVNININHIDQLTLSGCSIKITLDTSWEDGGDKDNKDMSTAFALCP
jgi:hypothetical protein